jgi:predicted transposase/invertase (TIGR01784 family)
LENFIYPTVDCVFKAILSAPGNENLLVNFLNSVLQPKSAIVNVDIINPYNEKEFIDDKLTIVDIKATDAAGIKYQVEVQLTTPSYLKDRMLYTWSDIYQTQISEGKSFDKLEPVIAIWLLTGNSFRQGPANHYHFQLWDRQNKELLTDHCSIHVLDLSKWYKPKTLQAIDFWLYLFKEGKFWKKLPSELNHMTVMEQAMSVLVKFSEQERAYHTYQSRINALRVQRTDAALLEQAKTEAANEATRADNEATRADNEAPRADNADARAESEAARAAEAEAEKVRLQALLRSAGIDPAD